MTWNLWWRFGPWEERQPAIADTLTRSGADVICLQEVWAEEHGPDQAAELAATLGFDHCRTDDRFHRGTSLGNAILSRWPILDAEQRILPPRLDGYGHRKALRALIDAPHATLRVYTTHLAYRFDESALRREQLQELVEWIDTERRGDLGADDAPAVHHPPVLAGDLNAVPTSDEIRMVTGEAPPHIPGLVLTDAWPQRGDGPGHTWDSANPYVEDASWPQRRIDYVMVAWPRPKPLGNVVSCRLTGTSPVDGVHPSDHYAVVADLDERVPDDR